MMNPEDLQKQHDANLKRIERKFTMHSPASFDRICIDGQPIGFPVISADALTIYCWLAWSLHDLEEHFRSTASRDAESSRNPKHHG